jgi:6-phosphogluconolactonase
MKNFDSRPENTLLRSQKERENNKISFIYIMKALLSAFLTLITASNYGQQSYQLLIGTYTNSGRSAGIHWINWDTATKQATTKSVTKITDPSYLAISFNKKYVYAVSEFNNEKAAIHSFTIRTKNNTLIETGKEEALGEAPCYITVTKNNRFAFIANYTGGSITVFPINKNGAVSAASQRIQQRGSSINTARQEKSHAHAAVISKNERFLFVQNLGSDKLAAYALHTDAKRRPLSSRPIAIWKAPPGSGPRHIALHPMKSYVYSINELTATVTVLQFNGKKFKALQTYLLPDSSFTGKNGAADIHISNDGKFLYASNRGDANEITVFAIQQNGYLKKLQNQSVLGKTPRNFSIDPSGNFLLVANQNSDEIVVFNRSKTTGLLSDSGTRIRVGSPVCIQFY